MITIREKTVDEKIAAIEATYESKFAALKERISTVLLADGTTQETKMAAIQSEYAELCNQMDSEIMVLLGGV